MFYSNPKFETKLVPYQIGFGVSRENQPPNHNRDSESDFEDDLSVFETAKRQVMRLLSLAYKRPPALDVGPPVRHRTENSSRELNHYVLIACAAFFGVLATSAITCGAMKGGVSEEYLASRIAIAVSNDSPTNESLQDSKKSAQATETEKSQPLKAQSHDKPAKKVLVKTDFDDAKITISYAKFGEGRHHARVEKQVEEFANQKDLVSMISTRGLKTRNRSGKYRPLLRVTYQVNDLTGTLDFKEGVKANIREKIIAHVLKHGVPDKKIEITYALFGNGSNKVRCEEQVAAVASQIGIETPMTTHGLSLRNPSGRVRKKLLIKYKVDDKSGEFSLNYGETLNLRQHILKHSASGLVVQQNATPQENKQNEKAEDLDKEIVLDLPPNTWNVSWAAGGKLLVCIQKRGSKLSIFDIRKRKLVKELVVRYPCKFAAGKDYLYVSHIDTIKRYSLKTFEEVESFKCGYSIQAMEIGMNSNGPLLVYNGVDWKIYDTSPLKFNSVLPYKLDSFGFDLSANGQQLCYQINLQKDNTFVTRFDGEQMRTTVFNRKSDRIPFSVSCSGTRIFEPRGRIYDRENDITPDSLKKRSFPSNEPGFVFAINSPRKNPELEIYSSVDFRPVATLKDFASGSDFDVFDEGAVMLRDENLVAILHRSLSKLTIRKFELAKEIARAGKETFFFTSLHNPTLKVGKKFSYQVKGVTNAKSIRYSLLNAPEGMSISQSGLVSWNVQKKTKSNSIKPEVVVHSDGIKLASQPLELEFSDAIQAQSLLTNVIYDLESKRHFYDVKFHDEIMKLPSRYDTALIGDGGKVLVLFSGANKKIWVVDLLERKIIAEKSTEQRAALAASKNHLLLILPSQGILQRLNLRTLEVERSVRTQTRQPLSIAAGCQSDETFAVSSSRKVSLWNLESMKPISTSVADDTMFSCSMLSASADGRYYCMMNPTGPNRLFEVEKSSVELIAEGNEERIRSIVTPSGSAHLILGSEAAYDRMFNKLDRNLKGCQLITQFDPRFVLCSRYSTSNRKRALELRSAANLEPLCAIPHLYEMDENDAVFVASGNPQTPRFHFLYDEKLFVMLSRHRNEIIFRNFDLPNYVKDFGDPFVKIISVPTQPSVKNGKPFTYQVESISSGEPVKYDLVDAPKGMTISNMGLIKWIAKFNPSSQKIEFKVHAKCGDRETEQTVRLYLGGTGKRLRSGRIDVAAKNEVELALPVKTTSVKWGCGGKMLFAHQKREQKISVLDIVKRETAKEIKVPADCIFAAGLKHLFIASPSQKTIERWSLENFKRDKTAQFTPVKTPALAFRATAIDLQVGVNSEGPLFVVSRSDIRVFDSESLKDLNHLSGLLSFDGELVVSADGKVITFASGMSRGVTEIRFGEEGSYKASSIGSARARKTLGLSPSGKFTFNGSGQLFADHKLQTVFKDMRLFPAMDDRFIVGIRNSGTKPKAFVLNTGDGRPMFSLSQFPDRFRYEYGYNPAKPTAIFLPKENTIAFIQGDLAKVTIRELNWQSELAKADSTYFFFNNRPNTSVKTGETFKYKVTGFTNVKELQYSLEQAPDGMTISSTGEINWEIKTKPEVTPVILKLSVNSGSDELATQQFELTFDASKLASEILENVEVDLSKSLDKRKLGFAEKTLPLPEKFDFVATGANGRVLLFFAKGSGNATVVDLVQQKVIAQKNIGSDAIIAAGRDSLLVASPNDQTLLRLNLRTLEREKVLEMPSDWDPKTLVAGSNSSLAFALTTSQVIEFWNMKTMTKLKSNFTPIEKHPSDSFRVTASANGKYFCSYGHNIPLQFYDSDNYSVQIISQDKPTGSRFRAFPSGNGNLILRSGGLVYDQTMKQLDLGISRETEFLQQSDERFLLTARSFGGANMMELRSATDLTAICKIPDLNVYDQSYGALIESDPRMPRARILFEEKIIASLPLSNEHVVFRKFDLSGFVRDYSKPFSKIISTPTATVKVGSNFSYQVNALASSKDVKFELIDPPSEMKISNTGKVDFAVKNRPIGGRIQFKVKASCEWCRNQRRTAEFVSFEIVELNF